MERIGFVTNNPHLKNELTKWFVEIPGEYEFVDLGPPATGDPPIFLTENNEKTRLIIFDSNFPTPLSQVRDSLNLPDVPWLAIGLEEHAHNPHALAINGANDLILTPLDRLVFLQKVEYLLAGSKSVTPSFLYLAKADLPVELGKAVRITHLSETSCTILAPRPLATGVAGTLISSMFGKGPLERVEVRAVESTPVFDSAIASHASASTSASVSNRDPEPRFEVRLRFFGLKKSQLAELRKQLSHYQPHGPPEIMRSEGDPKTVAHIAVISPQSSLSSLLRSSLEKLSKFEIDEFAGFTRFHGTLVARNAPSTAEPEIQGPESGLFWSKEFIGPKTPQDRRPTMPHETITLNVRLATDSTPAHVESTSPVLKPGEDLLGAPSEQWARDFDVFYKLLHQQDRQSFDEAVQWTLANSTIQQRPETTMTADISVVDASRDLCLAKHHLFIKLSLSEAATPAKPARIKVFVEDRGATHSVGKKKHSNHYETILIDASLLTTELTTKITQVQEWLEAFNIRNSFGNRTPIVVANANEDKISAESFRGTHVRQLVYDFNDRRFQAELFISLSRPEMWTSPQLALHDHKADLKAYLARPARASAVSEAGLVIQDRMPWREGTELLVLSPIWSQAPEGLWARLRSATPKDDVFENEFIFFGVSDLVEKEIRRFAREDYIKKKTQGQS